MIAETKRLIGQLDEARANLEAVVASADKQREIHPTWTVKDVLAHIAGWDDVVSAALRAHARGDEPEPLPVDGIDAYNALLVEKRKALTYNQVAREWAEARERLRAILGELPPEKIEEPLHYPWGGTGSIATMVSIFVEHEEEHAAEIRERLSETGEDSLKTIVITGSTRGIGYGLADAFLERGCSVAVSGRTEEKVEEAVARLAAMHGTERVFGYACDVTDFEQVQALWDAAKTRWGRVDIWINNAGIGHAQMDFWKHAPEEIAAVVETNVTGALYGARVALKGMLEQGAGSLYNMEGLGSGGHRVEGLTLYGSTKHGLKYLTDALAEETKGTPVLVGALRPGMVVTDFLTAQYQDRPEEWENAKRVFNILADRVETVTPWLADKVLANSKSGARIKWLSGGKAMGRFLTARFSKRDLFSEGEMPG